jgi:hypothetical protein
MVEPMAYMPSGVVSSPSIRLCPGSQPLAPSTAGMAPKTWYHPAASFSYAVRVAVVLAAPCASTTRTCCAPPVEASL